MTISSVHPRPARLAAQVMAALLFAGCARIQKERGHAEVAALVSQRAQARTHWDQGPPPDEELHRWVTERLRGGLTREAAVEIALCNNPGLQATYEELGVSQADMVQAGLLRNPSLGGSIGFDHRGFSEGEFSLVQDVLDLIVLPARKDIARERFAADTLRVAQQALDVVAQVARELAGLRASAALVGQREALLASAQAGAAVAERQHEAGNITELGLAEARAAAEQAAIDLAREQLALGEGRERLDRLLGLSGAELGWTLQGGLDEPPPSAPPLAGLEDLAASQRLDVQAARKEAQLLGHAVSLARSSRLFGRVEVGLHGHRDPNGPRLLGPVLALELPIFDQRQALIARLEAEERQGQRRLRGLEVETRSDVRVAGLRLLGAQQVVARYRTALLPLRAQIVELSQLHYNGMFLGLYQLLAARNGQIDAQRAYIEAVRDYWMAHADLERAVGGRLAPPAPATTEKKP
jgi:cobalt-zinc-cadmium efflux system outer membrane protein